jgi:hypothetical protein
MFIRVFGIVAGDGAFDIAGDGLLNRRRLPGKEAGPSAAGCDCGFDVTEESLKHQVMKRLDPLTPDRLVLPEPGAGLARQHPAGRFAVAVDDGGRRTPAVRPPWAG